MIQTIILAAGKGTRMKSQLPKVLHKLAGKPLLQHVIDTATQLETESISVVIGHGAELVRTAITSAVNFVEQKEQLGTGHAVAQALPHISSDATVLVLYGDVPLTPAATLQKLLGEVSDAAMAVLTVNLTDPTGYGRIIRNSAGTIVKIVEQKDASSEQLAVREVNTGIIAAKGALLHQLLPKLGNQNAQGEYYLTDVIEMAAGQNIRVVPVDAAIAEDVEGVNSRQQLAALERAFQRRCAEALMAGGVTLADPSRLDVRGNVTTGTDCFFDINLVLEGDVVIGNNVTIEPNCVLRNCVIGDNSTIKAYTHIEEGNLAQNVEVGPYARIRPGTAMGAGSKLGNFVETKKSIIGPGSKVNHLSYIGDSEIGSKVNVGAGTITCNYDGVNKFKTELGDGVFIGSNSSLVAPVKIGAGATVGAGSVITTDVPAETLAVARGKQRNVEGWQKPTKKGDK